MTEIRRKDLIYPELSYKIIGCAFDVYNEIGSGHHEKYYQRALKEAFKEQKLNIKEQVYYPLKYKTKVIGKNFLDFLIKKIIVVEIKKGVSYSKRHITQVIEYLKATDLPLAILITFGNEGVSFKRIVNFKK